MILLDVIGTYFGLFYSRLDDASLLSQDRAKAGGRLLGC
jgi:hypothetical protein